LAGNPWFGRLMEGGRFHILMRVQIVTLNKPYLCNHNPRPSFSTPLFCGVFRFPSRISYPPRLFWFFSKCLRALVPWVYRKCAGPPAEDPMFAPIPPPRQSTTAAKEGSTPSAFLALFRIVSLPPLIFAGFFPHSPILSYLSQFAAATGSCRLSPPFHFFEEGGRGRRVPHDIFSPCCIFHYLSQFSVSPLRCILFIAFFFVGFFITSHLS